MLIEPKYGSLVIYFFFSWTTQILYNFKFTYKPKWSTNLGISGFYDYSAAYNESSFNKCTWMSVVLDCIPEIFRNPIHPLLSLTAFINLKYCNIKNVCSCKVWILSKHSESSGFKHVLPLQIF